MKRRASRHDSAVQYRTRVWKISLMRCSRWACPGRRDFVVIVEYRPQIPGKSADRHTPFTAHHVNQLARFRAGLRFFGAGALQHLFVETRSAHNLRTSCLIFELPSAAASGWQQPVVLLLQLKYVAWLIPALRQISATGIPSVPCFK